MSSCFLGILVVLLEIGSTVNGYQCDERPRKFGCFRDDAYGGKRLMEFKFTKIMKLSDWICGAGWNLHLQKLICECSKKAKEEGHRYFGVENYHECWSGNLDHVRDIEKRRANNTKCWSEGPNCFECTFAKQNCVGISGYMEIYEAGFDSVIVIPKTEEPSVPVMTIPPNLLHKVPRPPPKIPGPPTGRR